MDNDNEKALQTFQRELAKLYASLSPKEQRKAIAASMRREANRLKKAAQTRVRTSGLSAKTGVDKGVYARVYPKRYGTGFMVSVKPHGAKKGIHTNRQGKQKPVLLFAEEGTKQRNVGRRKGNAQYRQGRFAQKKWRDYNRSGHSTGRMSPYKFLAMTEQTETAGIEQRLWTDFERNVDKAAKKGV